jgi:hypothetical protein
VRQEIKLALGENPGAESAVERLEGPDVRIAWLNTKRGRRLTVSHLKAQDEGSQAAE